LTATLNYNDRLKCLFPQIVKNAIISEEKYSTLEADFWSACSNFWSAQSSRPTCLHAMQPSQQSIRNLPWKDQT